jgi:hypothetical protein
MEYGKNKSASLIIIVQVKNNAGHGTASPSDFIINIQNIKDPSNYPNPQSFAGSKEGTIVALQEGTYNIDASASIIGAWYDTTFSGDCTSTGIDQAQINIKPDEKKTCVITKAFSKSSKQP